MTRTRTIKKVVYFLSMFSLAGCASKRICPSEAEAPVSTCRAEAKCGGFGTGMGMILGGFNTTANARNPAVDQYNRCLENEYSAQRANAGIQSNNYNCKSEETSPGHYETKCNQQ